MSNQIAEGVKQFGDLKQLLKGEGFQAYLFHRLVHHGRGAGRDPDDVVCVERAIGQYRTNFKEVMLQSDPYIDEQHGKMVSHVSLSRALNAFTFGDSQGQILRMGSSVVYTQTQMKYLFDKLVRLRGRNADVYNHVHVAMDPHLRIGGFGEKLDKIAQGNDRRFNLVEGFNYVLLQGHTFLDQFNGGFHSLGYVGVVEKVGEESRVLCMVALDSYEIEGVGEREELELNMDREEWDQVPVIWVNIGCQVDIETDGSCMYYANRFLDRFLLFLGEGKLDLDLYLRELSNANEEGIKDYWVMRIDRFIKKEMRLMLVDYFRSDDVERKAYGQLQLNMQVIVAALGARAFSVYLKVWGLTLFCVFYMCLMLVCPNFVEAVQNAYLKFAMYLDIFAGAQVRKRPILKERVNEADPLDSRYCGAVLERIRADRHVLSALVSRLESGHGVEEGVGLL